jgi:hypothetical protein
MYCAVACLIANFINISMPSTTMLERLLIIIEHLVILIGHPRVKTLLLVCVDVAGSLERCEIRQIVKGFGSSQEDQDLFETPVWTSGCALMSFSS